MLSPKVLVATPMYGGMATGVYVQSLTQLPVLAKQAGVEVSFAFLFNNSLIPHARNQLADIFLAHDFTHLFFIDADIEFKPDDFLSMVAADKPVIAGIYPKKKINWETVHAAVLRGEPPDRLAQHSGSLIVQFLGEHKDTVVPLQEPFKVRAAGTGFMCIKREVFEKLAEHVKVFKEDADLRPDGVDRWVKEYFYIDTNPETHIQMSEDIAFCWLARQHGIPIYIAPWVKLGHMGTYLFAGSPVLVPRTMP